MSLDDLYIVVSGRITQVVVNHQTLDWPDYFNQLRKMIRRVTNPAVSAAPPPALAAARSAPAIRRFGPVTNNEKAPAMRRTVLSARAIEIVGTGQQRRRFVGWNSEQCRTDASRTVSGTRQRMR
jgi:hypothetical protein